MTDFYDNLNEENGQLQQKYYELLQQNIQLQQQNAALAQDCNMLVSQLQQQNAAFEQGFLASQQQNKDAQNDNVESSDGGDSIATCEPNKQMKERQSITKAETDNQGQSMNIVKQVLKQEKLHMSDKAPEKTDDKNTLVTDEDINNAPSKYQFELWQYELDSSRKLSAKALEYLEQRKLFEDPEAMLSLLEVKQLELLSSERMPDEHEKQLGDNEQGYNGGIFFSPNPQYELTEILNDQSGTVEVA
jgi:hypothetical protein